MEHVGLLIKDFVEMCPCTPDRFGIWKCWFLMREETRREPTMQNSTHI